MFLIGRLKHFLIFLLLVLVVVFFRWNGRVSFLEMGVYWVNDHVKNLAEVSFLPYGDMEKANKEVLELKAEQAQLQHELAKAREEIERLRFRLLTHEMDSALDKPSVRARVIGRTPGRWYDEVVIDAGTNDGVKEGHIALAGGGLAGKVVHTTASTSVIRLITGGASATSAMIRGATATYGIVYGDGTGLLNLESVPKHAGVEKDDIAVTSGLGGVYPPDLPIGKVVGIDPGEHRLSPIIDLESSADLEEIYYLLVVEP